MEQLDDGYGDMLLTNGCKYMIIRHYARPDAFHLRRTSNPHEAGTLMGAFDTFSRPEILGGESEATVAELQRLREHLMWPLSAA